MSLICIRIRNSFSFEWLCTRTRFETEACSNSEMGYLTLSGPSLSGRTLFICLLGVAKKKTGFQQFEVVPNVPQMHFSVNSTLFVGHFPSFHAGPHPGEGIESGQERFHFFCRSLFCRSHALSGTNIFAK